MLRLYRYYVVYPSVYQRLVGPSLRCLHARGEGLASCSMEGMRGPFIMTSSLAQLWAADADPQEGRRRKGHKRKGASGSTSMAARAEAEEERRLDFLVSSPGLLVNRS